MTCKIQHVDRAVNDKTSLDNILLLIDNKNHQPQQSLGCKILLHY